MLASMLILKKVLKSGALNSKIDKLFSDLYDGTIKKIINIIKKHATKRFIQAHFEMGTTYEGR